MNEIEQQDHNDAEAQPKTPDELIRERLHISKLSLEEQRAKHERQKKANAKTHCRCSVPLMRRAEDTHCRACLKPFDMVSMTLMRNAKQQGKRQKYGSSAHRFARIDKFQARVKRDKEKRARAKKNRRRK
jgi:hypothetical protein